ncbi:hypothetical protein PDIG_70570 [Penicillium digitatum PHI26]|uniref:Mandelate racemase/muconate lactonizing enzyme N-terminal domain-containing protein n=2 Tax=Penicillium digitatum TaxID=36651 RepID=K9G414_PEND2|nr:hypothetical protein PDIP_79880 [Penicillium digitatum Pd1]EKV06363.1 hypothetical protein PDIP_79880 [Penicillium digitatum Pd1]EKV07981.1 hypothetical protein PDIG_70570 [Penicillium digitatum PHI26]
MHIISIKLYIIRGASRTDYPYGIDELSLSCLVSIETDTGLVGRGEGTSRFSMARRGRQKFVVW